MALPTPEIPILPSFPRGNNTAAIYPDGFSLSYWDLWFILAAQQKYQSSLKKMEEDFVRMLCNKGSHENGWYGGLSQRFCCEDYVHHLRHLMKILPDGFTVDSIIASIPEKLINKEQKKALEKILKFYGDGYEPSPIMKESPRITMEKEAMRGQWDKLTINPAPIAERMKKVYYHPKRFFYKNATFSLSRKVGKMMAKEVKAAESILVERDAHLYAVYRAAITTYLEEYCWDDSYGNMSQEFIPWLEKLGTFTPFSVGVDAEIFLRDILYLFVWEDYGCSDPKQLKSLMDSLSSDEIFLTKKILNELHHRCVANYQWYRAEEAERLLKALVPKEAAQLKLSVVPNPIQVDTENRPST